MIFLPEGVRLVYIVLFHIFGFLIANMILMAIGQALINKLDKATSKMEEF